MGAAATALLESDQLVVCHGDMNFGRSDDELCFDTCGTAPDVERILAYRQLWDASAAYSRDP
ncbi:hypothetical protein [Nesterenkonia sphaerica]|uniref:Uncharacterized protein n=1 Tax=Nesterenkonia sphaerica TaxID=1804988 RepID=A0A5R9AJL2_9MICC|nr:hypothetical protein [Nesterenkonia sphaerica]TLP78962.1 hypothetical protein FEF27_03665 [Nesterenkonia sphaerica]